MNDLTFDEDGWLAYSYRRFVQLGGRERNPENLCRFLRVALFWSPLRRFFRGHIAAIDASPFAAIVTTIVILSCSSLLIYFLYVGIFPDWISLLMAAWILFVFAAFMCFLLWLEYRGAQIIRENIRELIDACKWHHRARRGRLCPYIRIERKP